MGKGGSQMKVLFLLSPLHSSLTGGGGSQKTQLSVGHFMVYRERNIDLGVGYLAAMLKEQGHGVRIVDCDIERADEDMLRERIREYMPDLIGISGTTENRLESYELGRIAKRSAPEIPVVYGGIHATFTADLTLERIPQIDYVMVGECEYGICELVEFLSGKRTIDTVSNLVYRNGKSIVKNDPRQATSLDSLPFPAREDFPLEKYERGYLESATAVQKVTPFLIPTDQTITHIITSRGCPNRCVYCSNSAMRSAVRFRSAKNVADEIEQVIERHGIRNFSIADDTFTLRRDHVLALTDELQRRNLDIRWRCNVRVNTVDSRLLVRMHDAGCRYVAFGVESGSPRVLKAIGKNIRIDDVLRAARAMKEAGMVTRAFFMFGLPTETMRDAEMTIQLIRELRPLLSDVWISFATLIFPGTELERWAREKGLFPQGFDWTSGYTNDASLLSYDTSVPLLMTKELGAERLRAIQERLIDEGIIETVDPAQD